jgi:hypothetical protein
MVLEADKTNLTGWGEILPQFHTKYNHFLGYLYFRSDDVDNLPWTTTKQGINKESPAYQRALSEMRVQARPILNFLNDWYPQDVVPSTMLEREVIHKAESVSIDKLPRAQAVFSVRRPSKKKDDTVPISYRKPRAIVEAIKKHLGKPRLTSHEVGALTFDRFVEQEIDE